MADMSLNRGMLTDMPRLMSDHASQCCVLMLRTTAHSNECIPAAMQRGSFRFAGLLLRSKATSATCRPVPCQCQVRSMQGQQVTEQSCCCRFASCRFAIITGLLWLQGDLYGNSLLERSSAEVRA